MNPHKLAKDEVKRDRHKHYFIVAIVSLIVGYFIYLNIFKWTIYRECIEQKQPRYRCAEVLR